MKRPRRNAIEQRIADTPQYPDDAVAEGKRRQQRGVALQNERARALRAYVQCIRLINLRVIAGARKVIAPIGEHQLYPQRAFQTGSGSGDSGNANAPAGSSASATHRLFLAGANSLRGGLKLCRDSRLPIHPLIEPRFLEAPTVTQLEGRDECLGGILIQRVRADAEVI